MLCGQGSADREDGDVVAQRQLEALEGLGDTIDDLVRGAVVALLMTSVSHCSSTLVPSG